VFARYRGPGAHRIEIDRKPGEPIAITLGANDITLAHPAREPASTRDAPATPPDAQG
jgi:hypothetical protein